MIHFTQIFTCR